MSEPKYACPVCFYPNMEGVFDPLSYDICPCCGTEYGNTDSELTHEQLRESWINNGMEWWYKREGPSANWNAQEQLNAGLSKAV